MKNKVLRVAIVVILIIVMTIMDFITIGMNLTYALENIINSTNNDNVKFATYLRTEDGEKVSKAEYEMNNTEMKLYMEVAVENEGYFDGVITLEDSNFKLKQEILSEEISRIEGNTITLNRVRAGNTVEIEVGIEPIIDESYEENMLSKESVLKLTGEYIDSTEKSQSIESKKTVALTFLVPNNIETVLDGKVITNRIYKIGEENKRIVQIQLDSKVVENAYPIKSTTFEIALPAGIEDVEVIAKETAATNGQKDRSLEENMTLDTENNLLRVSIENTSKDGKISWIQDAKDSIIATLILSETQEILSDEYNIKAKVEFQGKEQKIIEKAIKYNLAEEADGIIRTSIENKENIYKGKIYSKEEREYISTTNIEVNYANLIEGNVLEERTVYRTEVEDKQTNIEYKTTTISKAEFNKVLGEEGKLVIRDQIENEIITITKDTETDENGNITITYPAGVKELIVEITKAAETGIIRLNHTKVIKAEEYTREEILEFKYLVEQAKIAYSTAEYTFERIKDLKETTSQVGLTVMPQIISAEESKEMQIAITLKTDNEKYELYKNPTFILTMPDGLTVNNVSNGTISATDENLTISKLEVISSSEIRVEIAGEQQKYVTSDINTQINFTANISIEKLMANKVDTIKMQYTNKEKTYDVESEKINVVASNAKIVTHLKLENYNGLGTILERYSDSSVEIKGKLPLENNEIIQAPVKYTIINNYSSAIELTPSIIANRTYKEENEQLIMNYSEDKITLQAGEMRTIEQVLQIPAGLYYSENIELIATIQYTYSGTEYIVENDVNLETEVKEGIRNIEVINGKIQIETFMQYGNAEGIKATDEIYNEQIVKYIIQVTNISNEVVSNLTIKNNQKNGNIYDLKEIQVTNVAIQEEPFMEHRYGELDTNIKTFDIGALNPGESRELVCKVVVKKSEESNITTANISMSADGIEECNVTKISNTVKDAELKVSSRRGLNEEVQIYADSSYLILTTIKNLTDKEVKDVDVRIHLSEGLIYKENYPIEALNENEQDLDIVGNINYNQEENYIDVKITNLSANQEIILTSMLYIEEIESEVTSKDVTVYLEVNDIISNDVISNIEQMETKVTVVQNVNVTEGQKIKNGDRVIITGEIANAGNIDSTITIKDKLPSGLEINRVTVIKNGERIDKTEEVTTNNAMEIVIDISKGETISIEIEATVNTSKIVTDTIENTILVKPFVGDEVSSNTITLTVESTIDTGTGDDTDYEKPEDPEPEEPTPEQPEQPENPDTPTPEEPTPEGPQPEEPKPGDEEEEEREPTYSIAGSVWVDKNKNAIKEDNEELKDVIVKLIDVNNRNTFLKDENGKEIEVKTNVNGEYIIENIAKGKYNIIFKYDTSLYELSETSNIKDYIVESTKEKVAITNNINLEADSTVDLQLIELTEFNLKMDKYISKVIVQTVNGTKTAEYSRQQLVREEIQSKYLSGASVIVEYTLEISNIGELAGYVTEVIDYLPSDMEFHSELNTQWYRGEDGNLYNTSLATTTINPGESKTLKLILLKSMTKENTGTTSNIAEISDTMNIKDYADIDLANNQSKAEIIVNPATGTVIAYLIAIINSIVIVSIGLYMIKKKIIK